MVVTEAKVQRYGRHLRSLLPRGPVWPREEVATLTQLLVGLATEPARVDDRALVLREEVDPRTTEELLADWERALGLPDPCVGQPKTVQRRRAAIVARLTELGGQSRAFFIALAATLGFTITITEHDAFQVGESAVGDNLNDEEWRFVWTVNAPEETVTVFQVGKSRVGEALADWGNEALECAFTALKPAHTLVQFSYALGDVDAYLGVPGGVVVVVGGTIAVPGGVVKTIGLTLAVPGGIVELQEAQS